MRGARLSGEAAEKPAMKKRQYEVPLSAAERRCVRDVAMLALHRLDPALWTHRQLSIAFDVDLATVYRRLEQVRSAARSIGA
jgi:hypothetical protein